MQPVQLSRMSTWIVRVVSGAAHSALATLPPCHLVRKLPGYNMTVTASRPRAVAPFAAPSFRRAELSRGAFAFRRQGQAARVRHAALLEPGQLERETELR